MLDRKNPPPITPIANLQLPEPEIFTLPNGLETYVVNMGTQDIVKIEVVYFSGRPVEEKKVAAITTARMLREGTSQWSSEKIAEQIDFYGGTLSIPVNLDTANVTLYSLKKHLPRLLPLLADMLSQPDFPEEELESLKQNSIQKLKVDISQADFVAYRQITEQIFGANHPYGYNSEAKDYNNLHRADLFHHFENYMVAKNAKLFISGKIDKEVLQMVEKYLGQIPSGLESPSITLPSSYIPTELQTAHIDFPDTVQTSVRLGRKMFGKSHPDSNGLYVLNTILGGYFGSRLMVNIRENKGYTYHIYSSLDLMRHDGYFYVATEVSNDMVEQTTREIHHEMKILQNDLISDTELQMVKNYLLGNLLTYLDGPLNVINVLKETVTDQLPLHHFETLVHTIQYIKAEEIRALAQRYFSLEPYWQLSVGEKSNA